MINQTQPARTSSQLVMYFVLAYALTWIIAVPLALAEQKVIDPVLPVWTHYLAAFGPMLAAVIVAAATDGRSGVARLWSRMIAWRFEARWWGIGFSPLIVGLLVLAGLNQFAGRSIGLGDFGEVNFLPSLGVGALPLWMFTFGIGEETGWRGFALPRLQHGRTALQASAILAALWALWHLPFFFYVYDPAIVFGWAPGLVAGTVVLTWLFNSTGGSVLIAAVWHGCLNYVSASSAGDGIVASVVSALVMVWAVVVILRFKAKDLSSRPKVVE